MSRPTKLEDWQIEASNLMARTGCSLAQAATELQVEVSREDVILIMRRASFNRLLWEARHRYFNEVGSDPNYRKETAIGKLLALAQKLEEEGEHDKSAEVVFKVAKMQGWVGPESTVSVFGELSQRDMDAIRAKIEDSKKAERVN